MNDSPQQEPKGDTRQCKSQCSTVTLLLGWLDFPNSLLHVLQKRTAMKKETERTKNPTKKMFVSILH